MIRKNNPSIKDVAKVAGVSFPEEIPLVTINCFERALRYPAIVPDDEQKGIG